MLKKILLTLLALVVIFLGYAATRPNHFRVQRTVRMRATPDKIFASINDLHGWAAWSPWEKMDPTMKRTFSGPAAGPGAAYAWDGNSMVGAGRMEILQSTPSSTVVLQIDFLKPLAGRDTAEFTIAPAGDSTDVTWAMYGPNNYLAKMIHVVFNMDKMVGTSFEDGLRSLKATTEK